MSAAEPVALRRSSDPRRDAPPPPAVGLVVDGQAVEVHRGATVLEACRAAGVEVPTLCFLETLTPINACRLCVVEVEGSRTLVAACSRDAEQGMVVHTGSERVRTARRMVLELLASSVDLSAAGPELTRWVADYGARPVRHGPAAATVAQPVLRDNPLFLRDYAKCVLCYRCIAACGDEVQHTFAIGVAGRGFDARIATEHGVSLPDSACVFCGNCVAVCPTGALMGTAEHDLRARGEWDEDRQHVTRTVCPYCGVGCNVELRVQDNRVVRVTSPLDHEVTNGNLCVKGRFGLGFVELPPD